jgi:hypothetical protein
MAALCSRRARHLKLCVPATSGGSVAAAAPTAPTCSRTLRLLAALRRGWSAEQDRGRRSEVAVLGQPRGGSPPLNSTSPHRLCAPAWCAARPQPTPPARDVAGRSRSSATSIRTVSSGCRATSSSSTRPEDSRPRPCWRSVRPSPSPSLTASSSESGRWRRSSGPPQSSARPSPTPPARSRRCASSCATATCRCTTTSPSCCCDRPSSDEKLALRPLRGRRPGRRRPLHPRRLVYVAGDRSARNPR